MNWLFAIVATLHLLAVIPTIHKSFQAKRLILQEELPPPQRSTATFASLRLELDSLRKQRHFHRRLEKKRCHQTMYNWLVSWYESLVNYYVHPIFMINGKYFDDLFLPQEGLEVAFQLYQANRMSFFVATRWINNLFVGMICVNCLSTPLIHKFIPQSNMLVRRLVEIAMSSFLNFINAVVIPVIIFTKDVHAYDPGLKAFPSDLLYDDVWYAKALRENEQ